MGPNILAGTSVNCVTFFYSIDTIYLDASCCNYQMSNVVICSTLSENQEPCGLVEMHLEDGAFLFIGQQWVMQDLFFLLYHQL